MTSVTIDLLKRKYPRLDFADRADGIHAVGLGYVLSRTDPDELDFEVSLVYESLTGEPPVNVGAVHANGRPGWREMVGLVYFFHPTCTPIVPARKPDERLDICFAHTRASSCSGAHREIEGC